MIHFAHNSSIYKPIFESNCPIISDNISLNDTVGQTTYRTWWKYIDPFCPTVSCSVYSSLIPLYCLSSTPFQPVSLTSMLAESIWESLVWHSNFDCSWLSGPSMPLSRSISDSMSAAQSSSLSFGFSKSPLNFSQFSVSAMVSGAPSSSLSTG